MSFDNNRAIPAQNMAGAPAVEFNSVMRLVYTWMGLGLLTTAGVAYFSATIPAIANLRTNGLVVILSLVAIIGIAIALGVGLNRKWLTPNRAIVAFFAFSGIMGFALSLTLQAYVIQDPGALFSAFGTTAVLFGSMSIFGYTTNMDLSKWGTYLFMALIGLIFAMLINLLLASSALGFIISFAGVVIFTALTAYDTQKIKEMSMMPELQSDSNIAMKISILGALTLYLDFINLFLFLLSLFGGGRE